MPLEVLSQPVLYGIPSQISSRVPFINTIRKVKQVVARSRRATPPHDEDSDSNSTSPLGSGTSTPRSRPTTPEESALIRMQPAPEGAIFPLHRNGVNWQRAVFGHQMLSQACHTAISGDADMSRTQYIDAMKYLHSGLPTDLSETEIKSLQQNLPINCQLPLLHTADYNDPNSRIFAPLPTEPNMIRSSTASLVSLFITIFMLAVPLLASLVNKALEYEREHRLTERAIQRTTIAARSAGSASLTIGDQFIKFNQTPLASFCLLRLGWLAQSVVEGLNDGLQQSVKDTTYRRAITGPNTQRIEGQDIK